MAGQALYGGGSYGENQYGGLSETQPSPMIKSKTPPEQFSFFIHRVDEEGTNLGVIFDARDHNGRGNIINTKLLTYKLVLENNRGRRLIVNIDDKDKNLLEVTKGYLMSLNLGNEHFGDYRSWSFEFQDSAGDFIDNFSGTKMTPVGSPTWLNNPTDGFGRLGFGVDIQNSESLTSTSTFPDLGTYSKFIVVFTTKASLDGVNVQTAIGKRDGGNEWIIRFATTGALQFIGWETNAIVTQDVRFSTSLLDGNEHTYIILNDNTASQRQTRAWRDGVELAVTTGTATYTNAIQDINATLRIGNDTGGLSTRGMKGDLDEMAVYGMTTLPSDNDILKIFDSLSAVKRYMDKGIILKHSWKNNVLTLEAFDKNIPDSIPIYDLMFEGQFAATDEVGFAFERVMDISAVVSDTNVDIKFQKASGVDFASTDKIVRPIIFRIPKDRFIDVQSAGFQEVWEVSGADFSRQYTEMVGLTTNERVEIKNMRIGFCLDFNGVSGTYQVTLAHFDDDSVTIPTRTSENFTSDGTTGFKWVYHDMSATITGTKKDPEHIFLIGIEAVSTTWNSALPLKVAILHATDDDNEMFGVTVTNVTTTKVTPGGLGYYFWRTDELSETTESFKEGTDFDMIDDNFIRILDGDKFQVPDSLILTPIPSLIRPAGSVGGFALGSCFYSTGAKNASNFIDRIFDKIGADTEPAFEGRILTQDLPLYVARGGSGMDHVRNIMRLSDSELTQLQAANSLVRDKRRSGYIKNLSFETAGNSSIIARFWKSRTDADPDSQAERITTDSNTGDASFELQTDGISFHFAEIYQDLADIYAGQHFNIYLRVSQGTIDGGINTRINGYNYGSFNNEVLIDNFDNTELTSSWKKFTFTITQTDLDTIGSSNRIRIGIEFITNSGTGGIRKLHVDDVSPILLFGFKDGFATQIGNVPSQIDEVAIIPEPQVIDSMRKDMVNIIFQKSGATTTGFSTGKPHIAIAWDKRNSNIFGLRGTTRQSRQRATLPEIYAEALSRLNSERERTLALKLAGQWPFLGGENIGILYPAIGLNEYTSFPVTSIEISESQTTIKSRVRIAEIAKPVDEKIESKEGIFEDVFEAPVRDKFTQLYFFATTSAILGATGEVSLQEPGVYEELTTDIKTMPDGTIACTWRPKREEITVGTEDDLPYITTIRLFDAPHGHVLQGTHTIDIGYPFARVKNQWVQIWISQEDV